MSTRFARLAELDLSPPKWLWHPRIPFGAITTLEADPGCGKSLLSCDLAARISAGLPCPDAVNAAPPANILLLQAEDDAATTTRRIQAAGGDPERIIIPSAHDTTRALCLPGDMTALEELLHREQIGLVIIDPLAAWTDVSISNERAMRQVLQPLAALARGTNAAILIVRHLTKSQAANVLHRGAGAIGLVGIARSALLLSPDPLDASSRILAQIKSNSAELAPSLRYRICQQGEAPVIEWHGPTSINSVEIGPALHLESAPQLREAIKVLFSILATGPVLAKDAAKRCREAQISERTMRRAKALLGVSSRRRGFGPTSQFDWELPEHNELVRELWSREADRACDILFDSGTPGAAQSQQNRLRIWPTSQEN